MTTQMKPLTIGVATPEEVRARALAAMKSGQPAGAFLAFASAELLWKVLTQKRWTILRATAGAGPLSIREIARRVDRDVKAVHADVHALLDAGVINRTADGMIEFPFDAIHVDFMLAAA